MDRSRFAAFQLIQQSDKQKVTSIRLFVPPVSRATPWANQGAMSGTVRAGDAGAIPGEAPAPIHLAMITLSRQDVNQDRVNTGP
jgi:hypothetical protein